MADFLLKYADAQGAVHQQVEAAENEQELREKYSSRGLLIYSIKPRRSLGDLSLPPAARSRGGKVNLEQFLIFNQQFVTLTRAGLPILKSLDLLVGNIKNKRLGQHLQAIHEDVKTGTPLSEAFRRRGVFPPIYTTSLMAGEKSGALPEVIDRYVQYQKMALSVRKKVLVSLIYPALLVVLVFALVLFLVTFVVPEFASLYESMDAQLPYMTELLVAFALTFSENLWQVALAGAAIAAAFTWWARTETARNTLDRLKLNTPLLGPIWIKYQVSQLCRLLSTLLQGGIPLMQSLQTTADSVGSRLIREALARASRGVKEGRPLSKSLAESGVFPPLAIEMIHVGETTGALPAMMNSVAEFFDEDVSTHMTAALSLIEPAIMIFMGIFVAFVLIALYLPIFTLAETL